MKSVLTFINTKGLLWLATFSILLGSCKKDNLTANGNMTAVTRDLAVFASLHNSGSTPVHIVYGSTYKVELKGSSNLIPYFKTTVSNGKLEVGYERASVRHDDVEVTVTMPTVSRISLSGNSRVDLSGAFPLIDFLSVDISGSAVVLMKEAAAANKVDIDISGSGSVDFEKLNCQNAKVSLSGSGDARVTVQDKLKANISGNGKVYYAGNPVVEANVSGSGKVIKF